MRTVIYARYSSTLQNARSIEDQITDCRTRAEREGWPVVDVFADAAISGAAGIDAGRRPGLEAMLARVAQGGIDQVLVDTTSRIARDLGDAHHLRKRINFAGARLFTLGDGEIDAFKGAIKGLLDEQQRVETAHNVRRGQRGNISQGRASGGLSYGYRRVMRLDDRGEPIRGLREIDPDQAAIVQRIFREYVAGQSALSIAKRLNEEGVPPPKRGIWRASTLIGHRAAGFGLLCNPLYVGRLVYGRSKVVVDPVTRDRRSVPGDGQLHEGTAPHLRIVDEALWQEAQDQIERRSTTQPERQRRPKHILSGLGVCGVCGGGWVMTRSTYWGCSRADSGNACANHRLIMTRDYEARVMAELKGQMLAPDVVAAYLREYHREHARQATTLSSSRDRLERKLGEANRKVARLVEAVADGGSAFAEIRELLTAARDDRDRLGRELAGMEALPVLTLHPGLAEQYRRSIEALESDLADEATRLEAVPRLRKLIARIVATPSSAKRGVDLAVVRHIDEVLGLAKARPSPPCSHG